MIGERPGGWVSCFLSLVVATGCAGERCEKIQTPASLPITGRAVLEMRLRNSMTQQYELMGARVALDGTPLAELAQPRPCYREIHIGGVAVPGGSHRIEVELDVRGACWGFASHCGQRFRVRALQEVELEDDEPHWLDVVLSERDSQDPRQRPQLSFNQGAGEAFWKN